MQFLKGLAISLLGFLLFLSLSLFGTAFMLNQTILNPDFVVSQINKLDLTSLVRETGIIEPMIQDLSQQFSQQFPQAGSLVPKVLNDTMDDLEPWVKEEAGKVTYSFHDYLVGKSQTLSMTVSLAPVKDALATNLKETVLESPQLATAPPAIKEQITIGIAQLTQEMPATFDLKESAFPPEVRGTLGQVRQGISYFQTAYPALIGFMALLALGIILIYRQVKGATRSLGSTFLTYGVLGYAGIFAAQYLLGTQIGALGLPSSLQSWLPQFLNSLWAPLQTFNIAVGVIGLVLVIISIVCRHEPSVEANDHP
ncbi:hypothetical protein ACFLV4_06965 [Chloroflexota bacterium]